MHVICIRPTGELVENRIYKVEQQAEGFYNIKNIWYSEKRFKKAPTNAVNVVITVTVTCPNCRHIITVEDAESELKIICPCCNTEIVAYV